MSSSKLGWAAVVLGALAVVAIPAGALASGLVSGVGVLHASVIAVPAAFGLALIGLAVSRRATFRFERSVRRAGERTIRAGRFLVLTGLYLAVTGALALGFYGALRAYS
jgi:hypothetical protein